MEISLKRFRDEYLELMLNFLWRQWSALGVAGGSRGEEKWVIDPESLLVYSLPLTRYEPRLFDEILNWLVANGKWVDINRLRSILKSKNSTTKRLMSATAHYISQKASTYVRKWKALAELYRSESKSDILFITKDDMPHPVPPKVSSAFRDYGFIRSEFELRGMSKLVIGNTWCNIRILLRSLFGIGSRAECVLYLLTHEAGHPAAVARAIGVSVRAAQDTLIELADSDLVLTRKKGRRAIEYWLPQKRWWQFLSGMNYEDTKKAVWLNWIAVFTALTEVWEALTRAQETESEYMRSSKLREAMETISIAFAESNIGLPPIPGPNIPPEKYEQEFQNFVIRVLGALKGEHDSFLPPDGENTTRQFLPLEGGG